MPIHQRFANGMLCSIAAKFMSMALEEKRNLYKCKDSYKTLSDIQTWPEFFYENQSRLESQCK